MALVRAGNRSGRGDAVGLREGKSPVSKGRLHFAGSGPGAGRFAGCSPSSGGDPVDFASPLRATGGGITGTGADRERDLELRASRHARQNPDTGGVRDRIPAAVRVAAAVRPAALDAGGADPRNGDFTGGSGDCAVRGGG